MSFVVKVKLLSHYDTSRTKLWQYRTHYSVTLRCQLVMFQLFHRLVQPELPAAYSCAGRGMGFYQEKYEFSVFFTILFICRLHGRHLELKRLLSIKEKYLPSRGDCVLTIMPEKGYCRESLERTGEGRDFQSVPHHALGVPLSSHIGTSYTCHSLQFICIFSIICVDLFLEYSLRAQDLEQDTYVHILGLPLASSKICVSYSKFLTLGFHT